MNSGEGGNVRRSARSASIVSSTRPGSVIPHCPSSVDDRIRPGWKRQKLGGITQKQTVKVYRQVKATFAHMDTPRWILTRTGAADRPLVARRTQPCCN